MIKFNMNPKYINNKWYIEVFTKELGYTLLLENGDLPMTKTFNDKQDAVKYIKNIMKDDFHIRKDEYK